MRLVSTSSWKTGMAKLEPSHGLLVALATACAAALLPNGAQATSYTFFTYDNPSDPTFNQLLGINNSGLISGYFGSGAAGHPNQGYLFTPPSSYASENFPNSVQTQVTGLNNIGTTVGFFSNTNMGVGLDANYGFADVNGTFYQVIDPNTPNVTVPTNQLLGVNDQDIAVGFYVDAAGNSHGYTFNIKTFTYSQNVNAPFATSTTTAAINDKGVIAGFDTVTGLTEGFIDKSGVFKQFFVPGAESTMLLGLNDEGIAVGDYVNGSGDTEGLVYNSHNGKWFTLNAPLAVAPGGTTLNGINENGDIVGFYVDKMGFTDGLLALPGDSPTVPEPATWVMLLAGFCAIGLVATRAQGRRARVPATVA